jgi:nucleotide-binding universal stress UspA family protein
MITLKNILVATDFSEAAATALTYGRALADRFGAMLHIINVADNFYTLLGFEGYIVDTARLRREVEHAVRARLEATITSEDFQKVHTRTAVLFSSSPALSIVTYATNASIDLIVIGTHGHGGIAHLLMGGVAEKVVKLAPCPVLTVKPGEREFVIAGAFGEKLSRASDDDLCHRPPVCGG